ncbi:MAG: sigma-70 family RNA polymerase sigma factor [Planctomycetes bacterium]|nr:sigma-70 family RNA polymerase sigma factor [Planctomycetota bacterium]
MTAPRVPNDPRRDTDLMLLCGRGDRAAFAELVARYEVRLIGFIGAIVRDRTEAEDLFQEVFLRVHQAAPRYVPRARLTTWIYTIARNLCLNFLQKKRPRPVEELEGESPGGSEGERAVEAEELRAAVGAALARLTAEQREAVTLRYAGGLAYKQIAEVMGAPMGTVAFWVQEGLKKMGPELGRFAEGGDR